jgi:hypothetical protein
MTWKQITEAVEEAGVEESEEITIIQCENGHGDGTFHKMRLGRALVLAGDGPSRFVYELFTTRLPTFYVWKPNIYDGDKC